MCFCAVFFCGGILHAEENSPAVHPSTCPIEEVAVSSAPPDCPQFMYDCGTNANGDPLPCPQFQTVTASDTVHVATQSITMTILTAPMTAVRKLAAFTPNAMLYADELHENLSQRFMNTADNLDSSISRRDTDEDNKTRVNVALSFTMFEGGERSLNKDIGVQLDLPRTSRRLKLFISHVDQQITEGPFARQSISEQQSRIARGDNASGTSIGARYIWRLSRFFEEHVDVGINYSPNMKDPLRPPDVFGRTSLAYSHKSGPWNLQSFLQLYWNSRDNATATAGLYIDRSLTDSMNLSYAGNARRIAAKPVTQVFQSLSFPIALNSRNSLTPSLQAAAETIPEPQFTNYTVSLTLRRRLYRSWLFGSFTVAGDYSRDNHYIFSPRAGVQLELFFGGGA